MTKNALGAEILKVRKLLKLTQNQLGMKVGVSGGAISQFEKGLSKPSEETLNRLIVILECDLKPLWLEAPSPDKLDDTFQTIPLYPIAAYPIMAGWTELTEVNLPRFMTYNEVPVLTLENVDYHFAWAFEVKGNSMAPRYPHRSRYVVNGSSLENSELRSATGVYLFIINDFPIMVRRVISNDASGLTLKADATGEELTLELNWLKEMIDRRQCLMFKLGQAIHLPPEE
ncbi:XRE family transcriptional regulator [Hymenobacter arizonensis]|uniref:Helix-turn-helix n=1 Tax=Hymenobacter arizonensis TaxID=1227077 RepID=A0A1I5T8W6_HYMAR|nr:helix-turn-helix domain-containing protein [Hymenobacter arizonensis]SFP79482.1 Helix-turn-helix [Hymenobacter arizonensis]